MATFPSKWAEETAEYATSSSVGRIARGAVESFLDNDDLLRASALTYTSTLSIVPILALAFSALKGLGAQDQLRPLIDRYLALGSPNVADQLMSFIENVNATALGTAGAAFLVGTVVSTLGNIEQAFNVIFRVPRSRSYLRKFSDYLSILFTVPLLVAAALAFTTMSQVRTYLPFIGYLVPYLFVWAGFFFLYVFFPFTKVRYSAALIGSFISAMLFQLAQWGYVSFQVGVANYRAIYGALATVPIFLVWTYIAWSLILFGAELTAAVQRGGVPSNLSPAAPDFPFAAALHILARLARRQFAPKPGIAISELAREMGLGVRAIETIVRRLKDQEIVIESSEGKLVSLHLVRAPASIRLADILRMLQAKSPAADNGGFAIEEALRRVAQAQVDALGDATVADLISRETTASQAVAGAHPELKPAS